MWKSHINNYIPYFLLLFPPCAIPAFQKIRVEKKSNFDGILPKIAIFVHVLFPQKTQKWNFGCGNSTKKYGISIKDYKEYSEIYSSIEIEITLLKVNMVNLLILTKKIKCIYIFILMITKKKLKEIIKIKMKKLMKVY